MDDVSMGRMALALFICGWNMRRFLEETDNEVMRHLALHHITDLEVSQVRQFRKKMQDLKVLRDEEAREAREQREKEGVYLITDSPEELQRRLHWRRYGQMPSAHEFAKRILESGRPVLVNINDTAFLSSWNEACPQLAEGLVALKVQDSTLYVSKELASVFKQTGNFPVDTHIDNVVLVYTEGATLVAYDLREHRVLNPSP